MIFECKMCGQCCEGKGGIVLSEHDIERLCAFLGRERTFFVRTHTEMGNKKRRLAAGKDGFCIFFRQGEGCQVHAAKPDICRAWPFFRGNLEDEISFEMARAYCPGIDRNCGHEDFVNAGMKYLRNRNLIYPEEENAPAALKICK